MNDAVRLVEIFTAEGVELAGKQADMVALVAPQDVEPGE